MDGLGGYYAKWNKSERERQILDDIIYMWNLKSTINQWKQQKRNVIPDMKNKLVVTSGERENRRDVIGNLGVQLLRIK